MNTGNINLRGKIENTPTGELAKRLFEASKLLRWNQRGIKEDDPEVEIFLNVLDLQIRVEKLERHKRMGFIEEEK